MFKEDSHALGLTPGGFLSCSTMQANQTIENRSVSSLPAENKEGVLEFIAKQHHQSSKIPAEFDIYVVVLLFGLVFFDKGFQAGPVK